MLAMADRISETMVTDPIARFQINGVRFLDYRNGNAILGDSVGLGKTWQSIGYLAVNPSVYPVLIVCPSGVKYMWQRELQRHANLLSDVAEGKKPHWLDHKIWIINYDIMHDWKEWFLGKGIKQVIADEAQRLANMRAKRTIAVRAVAQQAGKFIALSATPIRNRPIEFFPMLNLVAPTVFHSEREYGYRFCGPRPGFQGHVVFDGATNLDELHNLVDPYMLRRTKEEVLKNLPKKLQQVIPIKIHMGEYIKARDNFIIWLLQNKGAGAVKKAQNAEKLVRMAHLKQLAAAGKMKAITNWIEDFLLDNPGQKLVMFSVHRKMTLDFCNHFKDAVSIIGGINAKEKQAVVDRFQTDPSVRLLFGNITAAGEGITLTASSTVGFAELSWAPADHEQAQGRINRHGQTASHINEYWFVAMGTIEEHLVEVLQNKSSIINQIVDGVAEDHIQDFLIDKMLKEAGKAT